MQKRKNNDYISGLIAMAELCNTASICEMDDRKLVVVSKRKKPSWLVRFFRKMYLLIL